MTPADRKRWRGEAKRLAGRVSRLHEDALRLHWDARDGGAPVEWTGYARSAFERLSKVGSDLAEFGRTMTFETVDAEQAAAKRDEREAKIERMRELAAIGDLTARNWLDREGLF